MSHGVPGSPASYSACQKKSRGKDSRKSQGTIEPGDTSVKGIIAKVSHEGGFRACYLLTYAEAQRVARPRFRALSDRGRAQVDQTAAQIRTIIPYLAQTLFVGTSLLGRSLVLPRHGESRSVSTSRTLSKTSLGPLRSTFVIDRGNSALVGSLRATLARYCITYRNPRSSVLIELSRARCW